jgi:hypothetical protein
VFRVNALIEQFKPDDQLLSFPRNLKTRQTMPYGNQYHLHKIASCPTRVSNACGTNWLRLNCSYQGLPSRRTQLRTYLHASASSIRI